MRQEGLLFPKREKKRKKKHHPQSIIQGKNGICFLCAREGDTSRKPVQEHHIYDGPNRKHSEEYGLKVYLCIDHHTNGPAAVHNNAEMMRFLQQIGQEEFERNHTRKEFMKIFGKNYMEDQK